MAELGLSRARVGLLIGFAFISVCALGMLAVGPLADRWPRPRLIAGGLAGWSAGTALVATAMAKEVPERVKDDRPAAVEVGQLLTQTAKVRERLTSACRSPDPGAAATGNG